MAGCCSNTPFCGGCIMWLQLASNHFKRVFCFLFFVLVVCLQMGLCPSRLVLLVRIVGSEARLAFRPCRRPRCEHDQLLWTGAVPMAVAAGGWSWCFKGRMAPVPQHVQNVIVAPAVLCCPEPIHALRCCFNSSTAALAAFGCACVHGLLSLPAVLCTSLRSIVCGLVATCPV